MERQPAAEIVSYIDADLFVFSELRPLFDEFGSSSIGIIPHNYPEALKPKFSMYGEYNVGWVLFRNDENGIECLRWWRDRCLEWCFDYPDQGRFGDQGYLNRWPELFKGVRVLRNPRVNLAPWNLANQEIDERGGVPVIDGKPVVFYHFQGVKQMKGRMYDSGVGPYGLKLRGAIKSAIYEPYITSLDEQSRALAGVLHIEPGNSSIRRAAKLPLRGRLKRYLKITREILLPRNFVILRKPDHVAR
jgi:hypothetical protein